MALNIDITYQGAMAAQSAKKTFANPTVNPFAGKEVEVTRKGEVFKLLFSDEMIEFKDDTADFFGKYMNVQNANPSNIIS